MSYIILETVGGAEYATIVTDENGKNKVFDTIKEALAEVDLYQEGIVVEV